MSRKVKSVQETTNVRIETDKKSLPVLVLRRKTDFPNRSFLLPFPVKKSVLRKRVSHEKHSFYRRRLDVDRCQDLSDSELIMLIKTQNREIYYELFNRYHRKLLLYIMRLAGDRVEAEDIVQDVFTKTYRSIESFDPERKFSSWIYRIAHNEAVNFLKKKNGRRVLSIEDVSLNKDKLDLSSSDEPLEDRLMHEENNKEIQEALKLLPVRYREVLEMRYFSEYSYEKIGEILDMPVNTVGTLINRAKKKLFFVFHSNK